MKSAPRIAIDARMVSRSGIGTCIQHWLRDVGYSIALGDPKDLDAYKDSVPTQIPFISGIYGYKEQLKFPYGKLRKSDDGSGQIPFGPFLAVAAPFMYLWGEQLFDLYVKFVFGE